MSLTPLPLTSIVGAFLLAFPALFSIVNPLGNTLIFRQVTAERSAVERRRLANKIGLNALFVLLTSLWLGSYILAFFGISLGALRIAGGLVVAFSAWQLLMAPEVREGRKASQASAPTAPDDDGAFFPLTMPLTTGPGTISVAVALSSQRPEEGAGTIPFLLGVSVAAAAVSILIWLCYASADRVTALLGPEGTRVVSRVVAFLLLCIGVQIVSTGVTSLLSPLLR